MALIGRGKPGDVGGDVAILTTSGRYRPQGYVGLYANVEPIKKSVQGIGLKCLGRNGRKFTASKLVGVIVLVKKRRKNGCLGEDVENVES